MRCRRVIGFMLGGLAASLIPEVILHMVPSQTMKYLQLNVIVVYSVLRLGIHVTE